MMTSIDGVRSIGEELIQAVKAVKANQAILLRVRELSTKANIITSDKRQAVELALKRNDEIIAKYPNLK